MANQVLLISIKPKWVAQILEGSKTVELRRRPPNLQRPVVALIYESGPSCCLRARCTMGPVISRSPEALWHEQGYRSCIERADYHTYFKGKNVAHAIEIHNVMEIAAKPALSYLRKEISFVPPQSWGWACKSLLELLEALQ